MAEPSNIARPYARALFELAQQQDDLGGWSERLELLAAITADPRMAELARNPRVSAEALQAVILDVAAEDQLQRNEQAVNLVRLLLHNGRISALPAIARAYAKLRAEAERVIEAEMITAAEIAPNQRRQFAAALQKKLGRTVNLRFGVDQALVGGAVVRAGDWVIDGSVRTQLEQLVGALRA